MRLCGPAPRPSTTWKSSLAAQGSSTAVGDEGGFAPNFPDASAALALVGEAVEKAGYKLGSDITLALDVASSEFYNSETGIYKLEGEKKELDSAGMVAYYEKLTSDFPIVSIEDGLDENDWEGWTALTTAIGDRVQLVGDDLFVTNASRIETGIEKGAANSVLVKVNQIGSMTETLKRSSVRNGTVGPPLSHTVRVRPRITSLPTWLSRPALAKSRRVRWRAPTGSESTTSSFASKPSWGPRPSTWAPRRSRLANNNYGLRLSLNAVEGGPLPLRKKSIHQGYWLDAFLRLAWFDSVAPEGLATPVLTCVRLRLRGCRAVSARPWRSYQGRVGPGSPSS